MIAKLTIRLTFVLLSGLTLAGAGPAAFAKDIVRYSVPTSDIDHRGSYALALLKEVLRRTAPEYGPFEIEFAQMQMERPRQFKELKENGAINVAAVPSSREWEQALPYVAIPVDMGLQSWRISFVSDKSKPRLAAVRTLADLKALRVGVGINWVTNGVLKDEGFNVVTGNNFNGLFAMLAADRFDYLPRSLRDIQDEFAQRREAYPSLAIDETMLIHHPFPSFFFIAPGEPRLAKRIRAGLEAMLHDGSLRRLVLSHHRDLLLKAGICSRKVFNIHNPEVDPALLKRHELWIDLFDPRLGICPAPAKAKR